MHLDQAETLLREMSEEHSLGLLYWGLAMTDLEAMRVSEALAASQKAMDIFARLGEREFWARAACNHSQHLMVKGVCNAEKVIHSNGEKVIHLRLFLTIRSGPL